MDCGQWGKKGRRQDPARAKEGWTPGAKSDWYAKTVDEALVGLAASIDGLAEEDARSRLAAHGPHRLIEEEKTPIGSITLGQSTNPLR